jgi:hypothetical protein
MKILRIAGLTLAALVALLVVAAVVARIVIDGPIGPIAGGRLGGEEQPAPMEWGFSDDHSTIAVEVRPDDPHSVTTICFVANGELYVPASDGAEKQWTKMALADPRARVGIGDLVYPVRLVRVEDPDELERAFQAAAAKYPGLAERAGGQIPEDMWVFRAERRHGGGLRDSLDHRTIR